MTAPAATHPASTTARRWPDLLLVGAAHAGIPLLRDTLARHPDLWFSEPPEPHFFSDIRPSLRFARQMPVITDEDAYAALFATVPPGAIAADASTSYLWSTVAPERIVAASPRARIVIVLRDPIERAWAHHRADQAEGSERRGFLRAIRDELARPGRWGHDQVYLGAGFYAAAVARYRAIFAPDRLWIGFYESMVADPTTMARELLDWMGGDGSRMADPPAPAATGRVRGSWLDALRGRSSQDPSVEPEMDGSIRRLLEQIYTADVAQLSEQLGVIPPWSITPGL